jgi:ankyrin repeat protein
MKLRAYFEQDRHKELFSIVHKGNINREDNEGFFPIDACIAYSNNLKTFSKLLDLGADFKRTDKYGFNALHVASNFKKSQFISELLERRLDPYLETSKGQSALLIATNPFSPDLKGEELVEENKKINECITILSRFSKNINNKENENDYYNCLTPLETTINFKNIDGASILLNAGAKFTEYSKPPIVNYPSQTIMHNAVYNGPEYLSLLLEHGGNPNEIVRNRGKYHLGKQLLTYSSVLDYAIKREDKKSIEILKKYKAKSWHEIIDSERKNID